MKAQTMVVELDIENVEHIDDKMTILRILEQECSIVVCLMQGLISDHYKVLQSIL